MKRILSERSLVVILFLAALTVFSFAREDAKKLEQFNHSNRASSLLPVPEQTAAKTEMHPNVKSVGESTR